MVLPFAGRRQNETDTIVEGSTASAPENPNLLRIFLITTLIASCIFAVIYLIVAERIITLDDIPFFPKFDKVRALS